jgi:hypothetical protein
MTQAEYARHRGVTRQTIHELVGKGKIPYRVDDDDTKLINPADADFALGEARERVDDDDEDENTDGFAARPAPEPTLTRARTATEIYRARIAELQYQRLRGELAPVADVKDAADRCALALVAELEQLPARADEIAAAWAANGLPRCPRCAQGDRARAADQGGRSLHANGRRGSDRRRCSQRGGVGGAHAAGSASSLRGYRARK